jgi:hypothetical protein
MGDVVLFDVLIGTDGHVLQAFPNRTFTFNLEATEALMQWVYQPSIINGNPAEVITVVPVEVPMEKRAVK